MQCFYKMKPLLINLSNHPHSLWDEKQLHAAEIYGDVVELPFPDIPPLCNEEDIEQLSGEYIERVTAVGSPVQLTVHLMGEMTFCYSLLRKLQKRGIRCIASCARRNVTETPEGVKQVVFDFERFRKYMSE